MIGHFQFKFVSFTVEPKPRGLVNMSYDWSEFFKFVSF